MKGLIAIISLFIIAFGVTENAIKNNTTDYDSTYSETLIDCGADIGDSFEEDSTVEYTTEDYTAVEDGDWALILVNKDNPVPEGYEVKLTRLSNGTSVDSRIYPALQAMFNDARANGLGLFVREGYRTYGDQQRIMTERIHSYIDQGYSKEEADALAREYVAIPGTSEHQLGICVDINADTSISSDDAVYQWLYDNAYKYGFIKRYTGDKSDITGISDEPWHYRYVGRKAALKIHESGLCLEEYVDQIN